MDFNAIISEADDTWSQAGRDVDAFTSIAEAVLARHLHRLSAEAILEHLTDVEALPTQHDPRSVFGEPPITLARGEGLHLDAYLWLSPSTSVHNHIFTGAFAVLEGRSLHVEYDVEVEARYDGGDLFTGQAEVCHIELLSPGDIRPIARGLRFVHQVAHLSRPSLSLVLRTSHPSPDARSYTFLMPRVGFAGLHRLDTVARRQIEVTRALFGAGDARAMPLLERALTGASHAHAAWLLRAAFFSGHDLEGLRKTASVSLNEPSWLPPLFEALEHAARHPVYVSHLVEPGHRLLYLLTAASQDRACIVPILQAFCDNVPWEEAVASWILELAAAGRAGFWLLEPHEALIPALLRGEDPEAVLAAQLGVPLEHVGPTITRPFLEPLRACAPLRVLCDGL